MLRRAVAVDIGTTTIRVWEERHGILVNEPAVVAVDQRRGEVVAVGTEALTVAATGDGDVLLERPLRAGAISDAGSAVRCLSLLLRRSGGMRWPRPLIGVSAAVTLTGVERRALEDAVRRAGAAAVQVVDAPLAAAVGSGLPVAEPVANVVVDVGGGVTQAAVLALGGMVVSAGARVGLLDLQDAVRDHVRQHHGVLLGDRAVEEVLGALREVMATDGTPAVEVMGRQVRSGATASVRIDGADLRRALNPVLDRMTGVLRDLLARCPPELLRDVPVEGAHLVGGGALVGGLPVRFAEGTGIPVTVAEGPLEAAVRGAAALLRRSRGAR